MSPATALPYRPGTRIPLSAVIVGVLASLVNAVIALAAVALGAPPAGGLQPGAYVLFTVVAAVAGALGWHLINRATTRPGRVMRWLVPALLVVSFLPDIPVGLAAGWPTAGALMLMHVTTIAVAVFTYRRLMPLHDGHDAAATPDTAEA